MLDKHTKLLLHGWDGLVDASMYNVPIVNFSGAVTVSSEVKFFGHPSLYFNGSSNLEFQDKSLIPDLGDWTVEWWENRPSFAASLGQFNAKYSDSNYTGILLGHTSNGGYPYIYISNNGRNWNILEGAAVSNGKYVANTWIHWAYVRYGDAFSVFKNGTKVYTANITATTSFTGTGYSYYGSWSNGGKYLGYAADIRISDIARYTADFEPLPEPFEDYMEYTFEDVAETGNSYYVRIFPMNKEKDYQTMLTNQTAYVSTGGTSGNVTI